MDRRSLLGAVGALGVAAGSGCLEAVPSFDSTLRVPWLAVQNETRERRRIDLRLDRNGETLHESTHTLDAGRRAVVECTWDDVEAEYAVAGRVADGEWETNDVEAQFEKLPDCAVVTLECYPTRAGTLGFSLYARALCESYDSECAPTSPTNAIGSDNST